MLFFLLIYSQLTAICSNKSIDVTASHVDPFPHNIDQDFSLQIKHPEIEHHHIYAIFILQVNCPKTLQIQKLYIYPGFTKKLDHRLKETLFHVMNFQANRFIMIITLRFYRESNECRFVVEYSAMGAENIHLRLPSDLIMVLTTKVILFRPAKLKLSVLSEDGHSGGLSINKKGQIICRATDGFPFSPPLLTLQHKMAVAIESKTKMADDDSIVYMDVVASLNDHNNLVTCISGSESVTTFVRVFHRALSVKIEPNQQYRLPIGSSIKCTSIGGGYPTPNVQWTVNGLNDTTREFFTVSPLSQTVSTIYIGATTPNDTIWTLNCSSVNIIPPLDEGGPFIAINITIGDKLVASNRITTYLWIVVVLVSIIIIVLAAVLVNRSCQCSHDRPEITVDKEVPEAPQYSSIPHNDRGDDCRTTLEKDGDTYV